MADNKAKKEQVHNVFQNISGKYDRLNNIISFEQHKTWRKRVMKEMATGGYFSLELPSDLIKS